MKRFAFRLQRILDLREAQEKLRLNELGIEQQRLNQERHKLSVFQGEQELQIAEASQERHQAFSIWSQNLDCRYLQRIGRVIDFQSGRVAMQEQSLEAARVKYVEARKGTRALEILREKKLDDWKLDRLREEGNLLDEAGARKTLEEESCSTRKC
jgi:flagellar export protein FliJ